MENNMIDNTSDIELMQDLRLAEKAFHTAKVKRNKLSDEYEAHQLVVNDAMKRVQDAHDAIAKAVSNTPSF
jgi:hypothetical protein